MQPAQQLPGEPRYSLSVWQQARTPIFRGALKGLSWLPGSGGKLLRILFGSYEPEQTMQFKARVCEGAVVYDVGAAVGYYSLLAARFVGEAGKVVAFEPDPKNAAFLKGHIEINGLQNVTVHETAVGGKDGEAKFLFGGGTGTGRLCEQGSLTVPVRRLDAICGEAGDAPDIIKIDVEGAEAEVLSGAADTIASARPAIFLSTHNPAIHFDCLQILRGHNYQMKPLLTGDVDTCPELLCLPG